MLDVLNPALQWLSVGTLFCLIRWTIAVVYRCWLRRAWGGDTGLVLCLVVIPAMLSILMTLVTFGIDIAYFNRGRTLPTVPAAVNFTGEILLHAVGLVRLVLFLWGIGQTALLMSATYMLIACCCGVNSIVNILRKQSALVEREVWITASTATSLASTVMVIVGVSCRVHLCNQRAIAPLERRSQSWQSTACRLLVVYFFHIICMVAILTRSSRAAFIALRLTGPSVAVETLLPIVLYGRLCNSFGWHVKAGSEFNGDTSGAL
ncbi:hypothetical protein NM688_g247 [Phlebia brevispora]|uniref:Uncharacterized protein n=1 Tax=Phlebia brevispora TaxID=194682 RepID=A0ACC1TER1_9APHY|nr:hypothetical protein NM688_g247 [Phlebia brevispora]